MFQLLECNFRVSSYKLAADTTATTRPNGILKRIMYCQIGGTLLPDISHRKTSLSTRGSIYYLFIGSPPSNYYIGGITCMTSKYRVERHNICPINVVVFQVRKSDSV